MPKVRLGYDFVQNGNTRYTWGVDVFKMLK